MDPLGGPGAAVADESDWVKLPSKCEGETCQVGGEGVRSLQACQQQHPAPSSGSDRHYCCVNLFRAISVVAPHTGKGLPDQALPLDRFDMP